MSVCIVTRANDFHAFAIADRLHTHGIESVIVETDALSGQAGMSWRPGSDSAQFALRDRVGATVRPADLDVVWWRRLTGEPRIPGNVADPAARDLIARDCRATLTGGFATSFAGRWVSHPEHTRAAEFKLVQLQAAAALDLRLPQTLVSQDPAEIRSFFKGLDGVIVKPVAGTPLTPLLTGRVSEEMLADDDALALTPAIYQHLIEGERHLRVCVFGDEIYAARLTSERLDWRYPLDVGCERVTLERELGRKLCAFLRALNLRMGIFDLKEATSGEPVFLEVNPQGQFLFLEGLCGMPLTDAFTDFMKSELFEARRARAAAPVEAAANAA
ncbi:MAG: hypothetical protein HOP13_01515 [Alphaproteobacteria bacterium]|nr:hypothetical protein [Alphaproteobacteria bacterium]